MLSTFLIFVRTKKETNVPYFLVSVMLRNEMFNLMKCRSELTSSALTANGLQIGDGRAFQHKC
jgi:hypothetical protein